MNYLKLILVALAILVVWGIVDGTEPLLDREMQEFKHE